MIAMMTLHMITFSGLFTKRSFEFEPPKPQGIYYLERESEGGKREGQAGPQAVRFKVRIGLGEIER